jgi:S-DNA-T family DNA segregation ATPase FtsK/SpoIIIE
MKWLAKEMERRYNILEAEAVRDISSYHQNVVAPALDKTANSDGDKPLPEAMPYIVVVIDELADIMTSYPREFESGVVRLAQMSRAVGIHLILSTQRPSVKVITGLIKANIPARVALQVASQIDSRTILDTGGAEKLLGAGDMLYLSGEMSKPIRLQSAFISESETKNVVSYLRNTYYDRVPGELNLDINQDARTFFESAMSKDGHGGGDNEDDLYEEAKHVVIEAKKASTSFLQRKLHVGYARAARLVDMLEERGVVGPGEGAKPRQLLGIGNDFGEEEEKDLVAYDS